MYYEGYKIGTIYGYESNGLYQTDADAQKLDKSELYGGTWAAGDVSYVDRNNDGKITKGKTLSNMGDEKIIGNDTPRYSYGLTAGFEYKGFDFEMFWQGIGNVIICAAAMLSGESLQNGILL